METAQDLEAEIEGIKRTKGVEGVLHHFNNWWLNLPGARQLDESFPEIDALYEGHFTTKRELYKAIDEAIEKLGIARSKVLDLTRGIKGKAFNERMLGLIELTISVYAYLREIGYQHYPDLIA